MSEQPRWLELKALLQERLTVIADHAWRDRDPAGHLQKLRRVSEAIMAEHARHRVMMPPRLNHYLTQASYQKALEWLQDEASMNFSAGE